ncbi:MAG: hypothetical protein M1836_006079 [Candelina mexicana]|nr:MAG: hypothetical protein M1836_006079 [Candelina mexicana]
MSNPSVDNGMRLITTPERNPKVLYEQNNQPPLQATLEGNEPIREFQTKDDVWFEVSGQGDTAWKKPFGKMDESYPITIPVSEDGDMWYRNATEEYGFVARTGVVGYRVTHEKPYTEHRYAVGCVTAPRKWSRKITFVDEAGNKMPIIIAAETEKKIRFYSVTYTSDAPAIREILVDDSRDDSISFQTIEGEKRTHQELL